MLPSFLALYFPFVTYSTYRVYLIVTDEMVFAKFLSTTA